MIWVKGDIGQSDNGFYMGSENTLFALDAFSGPFFGGILIAISLVFMIQGYRKIKLLTFFMGAVVGFQGSNMVFPYVTEYLPGWTPEEFLFVSSFIAGLVLLLVIGIASKLITVFISLQFMLFIVGNLENRGFDIGDQFAGGILVILAFTVNRFMRRNLYLIGSAGLGSLMGISGYLIFSGEVPSQLELTKGTNGLIFFALFINSILMQKVDMRKHNAEKEQMEFEKEHQAETDVHGRGRVMNQDILTSGYNSERLERRSRFEEYLY